MPETELDKKVRRVADITDEFHQFASYWTDEEAIPPEVVLAILIRLTRYYADKCAIPLDRVNKAIEMADREGERKTCTT